MSVSKFRSLTILLLVVAMIVLAAAPVAAWKKEPEAGGGGGWSPPARAPRPGTAQNFYGEGPKSLSSPKLEGDATRALARDMGMRTVTTEQRIFVGKVKPNGAPPPTLRGVQRTVAEYEKMGYTGGYQRDGDLMYWVGQRESIVGD